MSRMTRETEPVAHDLNEPVEIREAKLAQSWADLGAIMQDLREANEHLVLANVKSQALATEVAQLYGEANEALQAKDAFFLQVSHELRTPMTSITGWATLLGIHPDPDIVKEAARCISSSAAVQAKLVNDLLDISRIMSRKFVISSESVNLCEVVEEAISSIRPLTEAKVISLRLIAPDRIDMKGDRFRLRQVCDNVLSNALKFTAISGLIEVTLIAEEREAVLIVHDDGEGISADFLPKVFNRHAQAATGRFGGLGLGMAIVKHIVESHGGTVSVESPGTGLGATFIVRLPLRSEES
jgi:signal transduction histidine kinase